MNNVTFKVGDLVRDTHIDKIGMVTYVYDEVAYRVLFWNGEYTVFIGDLEEI